MENCPLVTQILALILEDAKRLPRSWKTPVRHTKIINFTACSKVFYCLDQVGLNDPFGSLPIQDIP